jgi:hypothetical protein
MGPTDWLDGVEITVSACDEDFTTTFFNARASRSFEPQGGYALLGTDMRDCHPPGVREKFEAVMAARKVNAYTTEKAGKRKLVYQAPVFKDGDFKGMVELVMEIPWEMPHFVRG